MDIWNFNVISFPLQFIKIFVVVYNTAHSIYCNEYIMQKISQEVLSICTKVSMEMPSMTKIRKISLNLIRYLCCEGFSCTIHDVSLSLSHLTKIYPLTNLYMYGRKKRGYCLWGKEWVILKQGKDTHPWICKSCEYGKGYSQEK